jgi:hypothetical protein
VADGGGVRGYSQLLILKALMDKIETIERSEKVEGEDVDSSFHPICWKEVPITPSERRQRKKTKNVHTKTAYPSSGSSTESTKEGKKAEALASPAESSRFYPHHYFDWIAGTSTGGLVQLIALLTVANMSWQTQCYNALTPSDERR